MRDDWIFYLREDKLLVHDDCLGWALDPSPWIHSYAHSPRHQGVASVIFTIFYIASRSGLGKMKTV